MCESGYHLCLAHRPPPQPRESFVSDISVGCGRGVSRSQINFEGFPRGCRIVALRASCDYPQPPATVLLPLRGAGRIVGGSRDGGKAEAMMATYRAIPGAQLAIVPGADHFMVMTMPEKTVAMVVPFLDGVKPAAFPGG